MVSAERNLFAHTVSTAIRPDSLMSSIRMESRESTCHSSVSVLGALNFASDHRVNLGLAGPRSSKFKVLRTKYQARFQISKLRFSDHQSEVKNTFIPLAALQSDPD